MNTRETILQADDIRETVETVPEWDGVKILLRAMDGKQHARYIDVAVQGESAFRYADILINSAHDPDTRELLFDPADRDALMEKDGGVLMRLSLIVIRDLSGGDVDDATEELDENPISDGS